MQTARVHFKQQIRQAKCIVVDHKCCIHLATISYPIKLDQILEANDVCDGFLDLPDKILVAWYLTFLIDLETTVIACHLESICSLDCFRCKCLAVRGCTHKNYTSVEKKEEKSTFFSKFCVRGPKNSPRLVPMLLPLHTNFVNPFLIQYQPPWHRMLNIITSCKQFRLHSGMGATLPHATVKPESRFLPSPG